MNRGGESGFTLVELIVSLAIFALIAVAGAAMVDGVLSIQERTAGRLERLGDIGRAMFVIGNDLGQVAGGPVEGAGARLLFSRPVKAQLGLPQPVRYTLEGDALVRRIGARGAAQRVLGGVSAARFTFYREANGWIDRWPPDEEARKQWPAGIALDLTLSPQLNRPGGTLRRVVQLPVQP